MPNNGSTSKQDQIFLIDVFAIYINSYIEKLFLKRAWN